MIEVTPSLRPFPTIESQIITEQPLTDNFRYGDTDDVGEHGKKHRGIKATISATGAMLFTAETGVGQGRLLTGRSAAVTFLFPMNFPGSVTGALLVLGFCCAPAANAQTISTTSPFLPRNGSAGAAGGAVENSPVELRGIMIDDGSTLFGLYDPVRRQGGWLKLNEAGKDFPATVRNYDAANDAVTVEYQGRVLNLSLKTAKIEALPVVAQAPVNRPPPGQAAPVVSSNDNARQMEAVAAEVQRRRLQRQAAQRKQATVPGGVQVQPSADPAQRGGQP